MNFRNHHPQHKARHAKKTVVQRRMDCKALRLSDLLCEILGDIGDTCSFGGACSERRGPIQSNASAPALLKEIRQRWTRPRDSHGDSSSTFEAAWYCWKQRYSTAAATQELARRIFAEDGQVHVKTGGPPHSCVYVSLGKTFKIRMPILSHVDRHWKNAVWFVAFFARRMQSLKIEYGCPVQSNWILHIFGVAGHWEHSLTNLQVLFGRSAVHQTINFLSSTGLSCYPRNLRRCLVYSADDRTSLEQQSVASFLNNCPYLTSPDVKAYHQSGSICQFLANSTLNVRSLKLLPQNGVYSAPMQQRTSDLCNIKNFGHLNIESSGLRGEQARKILKLLPEASIVSLRLGREQLCESGADLLASYLKSPKCVLEDVSFDPTCLSIFAKTKLIEAVQVQVIEAVRTARGFVSTTHAIRLDHSDFVLCFNFLLTYKRLIPRWDKVATCTFCTSSVIPFILRSTCRRKRHAYDNPTLAASSLFVLASLRPDLILNNTCH